MNGRVKLLAVFTAVLMSAGLNGWADSVGITTRGEAFMIVPPDYMSMHFRIRTMGASLQKSQEDNAKIYDKIISALSFFQIKPSDLKSESYRMAPRYTYLWNEEKKENIRTLVGYETANSVKITLRDRVRHRELALKLFDAGATDLRTDFGLDPQSLEKYEKQVMGEAVRNARWKARIIADAARMPIGEPLFIRMEDSGVLGTDFFDAEMLKNLPPNTSTEGLQRIFAAVAAGFSMPGAPYSMKTNSDMSLQAEGSKDTVIKPDYLNITFSFRSMDENPRTSQTRNNRIFQKVRKEMEPFSIPDFHWQRRDRVAQRTHFDKTQNREILDGYESTTQVRISLKKSSLHRTIVAKLLAAGIEELSLEFVNTPETLRKYESQILAGAFDNGKARARILAENSRVQLGGIYQISMSPDFWTQPSPRRYNAELRAGASSAEAKQALVSEGTNYLRVTLSLRFAFQ